MGEADTSPTLEWGEAGWKIKAGGRETPPFKKMSFDYATMLNKTSNTSEIVLDELGSLIDTLNLTKDGKAEMRKTIAFKCLPEWRKTNPLMWIGKHGNCYNLYMELLERWIKHDRVTRQVIFLTALSAFSPNPLNLFVRGPSSIGKTYTVTQSVKFFPKGSVWLLGGLSPRAFVHDYGKLVNELGEEVDEEEVDWKSSESKSLKHVVDLSNKILIFLESPSMETFNSLRPIMSHDAPEIEFSFADRAKGGGLKTKHVFIRGWPAMINCSVSTDYHEELATRSINITPEMTEEKYRAAILLQGEMGAKPWLNHNPDETLEMYRKNMEDISGVMRRLDVAIPYEGEMALCYPFTTPRDMRDFGKLVTLIHQYTYFHLYQRPQLQGILSRNGKPMILSTLKDFKEVIKVFSWIAETTRSGLPGNVVSFFSEVMVPLQVELGSEISLDAVAKKWTEVYRTTRSKAVLRSQYLNPIRSVGWIDEDDDPNDKRKSLLKVIGGPEKTLERFEGAFLKLFKEVCLEKWMGSLRARGDVRVLVDGVEVDWAEFCYKYFTEWV